MLAGPVVDHAGGAGRHLGMEGEGIGFQEDIAVAGQNFELVQIAFARPGTNNSQMPEPGRNRIGWRRPSQPIETRRPR
jgi:hypothetical protein